jgi:isopenicillin N synthase-like dioxygenase
MIPILDLAEWNSAAPRHRTTIAAELDSALRETGMFLLSNHDVPIELTESMRSQGREFFDLPTAQRKKYAVARPYDNGWRGLGELVVGDVYGTESAPDLHEAYHIGPQHRTGDEKFDALYYPDNKWPTELPELQAAAEKYTAEMTRISHQMLDIFATILDQPADFFTAHAHRATWTQNVNWYPSLRAVGSVADGQLRVGPHSDFGSLSLLDRQQGVGGLQVWNDRDGWFAPPYEPNTLAVILGDLMNLWTDGRWRALRHRVLAPPAEAPQEELVSLVFFFEADPDARITPLAAPVGGNAGMAPVIAGESILEKVGISLSLAD